jgi:predicted dehydrogenase
MHAFDVALQTIAEALHTGPIGTPVAARVVAAATADHGRLERRLARLLGACAGWLGNRPDQLAAFGAVESGLVSALARFETGATALVTVSTAAVGRPLLEITVWGNRGILSWDGAGSPAVAMPGDADPALSEMAALFLRGTRDSLASGQSVQIRDGSVTIRGGTRTDQVAGPPSPGPVAPHRKRATPPFGILFVAGDYTHQPNYAAAFRADPRCRLIGLTDEANVPPRRKALNEQFARRLEIPLLPDFEAALRRDDVHVVSICAEPERRGPLIVQAARAGKHLYLDKPLAGSLADVDAVLTAIGEAGVLSQMWSLIHTGHADRVREVIRAGVTGDLIAIGQDLCFAKGQAGTAQPNRPRRESRTPRQFELPDSKRELTNVGVYPLVQLLWLTGRRVRRVCATTGNFFFREHQQNDMEDFGQMLLELDGGLVATISAGRTGWRSHPAAGLNRACLIGRRDALVVDADRPRVEVWADGEPWTAPQRDAEDPMGMWATPRPAQFTPRPKQAWVVPSPLRANDDIRRFLDCIEAGRASDVPAALGAEASEVLLAAYRSAATGEVVTVPLPRGENVE